MTGVPTQPRTRRPKGVVQSASRVHALRSSAYSPTESVALPGDASRATSAPTRGRLACSELLSSRRRLRAPRGAVPCRDPVGSEGATVVYSALVSMHDLGCGPSKGRRVLLVRALLLAGSMLLLLAAPAYAQGHDFDCSDFGSQAAAQRVYDSVPGDLYRLDTDGDGVACEIVPPTPGQFSAYLTLAIILTAAAGFGALLWQRHRPRVPRGGELEERLATLQETLRSVASSIQEIDSEVSARRGAVEQLQKDAQRAEELSRLSAREVSGIKAALEEVVSGFDRRSLKSNIVIAIITSILGIGGSILVNMYVP